MENYLSAHTRGPSAPWQPIERERGSCLICYNVYYGRHVVSVDLFIRQARSNHTTWVRRFNAVSYLHLHNESQSDGPVTALDYNDVPSYRRSYRRCATFRHPRDVHHRRILIHG